MIHPAGERTVGMDGKTSAKSRSNLAEPNARSPAIDFAAIKAEIDRAVPFNRYVGVELIEVANGWATARLGHADELNNHVGTMHAAALFLVGEFAAAIAFVGAFAPHMGGIRFVARHVEIDYVDVAMGSVIATGRLTVPVQKILRAIDADGRTRTRAETEIRDDAGTLVATLDVTFDVRRAVQERATGGQAVKPR
jgi:acyl-coenzyme A thioesterase PaaI-like protein